MNAKSHVPVHVQLESQLRHLILSGDLAVGSRLPSIRMLAGYLRVNRNTVARVVTELERQGYVETRRGSGAYVVEPPVRKEEVRRQRLLERVMRQASEEGVSVEDLGYELLARAGAPEPVRARIAFVECGTSQVERFSAELEAQLPVEVEGLLLADLPGRVSGGAAGGEVPWRLAATTFFHVHEVEAVMEPLGIETVALLAEANLESLQRLAELPGGTVVGVVGNSETCTVNLLRSLEGAGLDHLDFFEVRDADRREEVEALAGRAEVLVCTSPVARMLPGLGVRGDLEVIVEDRTLDRGGVEMLGRMLRD
ncbi:MAG: GntR family transcriptional regulator [Rubrobacter sp.]|nr:GntR family transcriptional regulator [Rubrobacter sp.]